MDHRLATSKELEEFFGVPIKDNVEIDMNTLYGYASCSNINPSWEYHVGSFLKLKGSWQTEMRYLEIIQEKYEEEEGFHNFAFFEIMQGEKGSFNPTFLITQARLNEELSKLDQCAFVGYGSELHSPSYVLRDLTILFNKEDMKPFLFKCEI